MFQQGRAGSQSNSIGSGDGAHGATGGEKVRGKERHPISHSLHLRHFLALLPLGLVFNIDPSWAQETAPQAPPGTATIYLANFSMGRSVFVIAPQESHLEYWRKGRSLRPDEQVACDVEHSSIFGQKPLFPGSGCRIYVDVTHDLWIAAVTFYPETRCDQYGSIPPTCWTAAQGYLTHSVHLTGLKVGETYEYDACGAFGVNVANCGWRQITNQDKVY